MQPPLRPAPPPLKELPPWGMERSHSRRLRSLISTLKAVWTSARTRRSTTSAEARELGRPLTGHRLGQHHSQAKGFVKCRLRFRHPRLACRAAST